MTDPDIPPSAPSPSPPSTRLAVAETLHPFKVLAILWLALALITGVFAAMAGLIGLCGFVNAPKAGFPGLFLGVVGFLAAGACLIVIGGAMLLCFLLYFRRGYTVCRLLALLLCLFIPLGTALGIATLVVLSKPHVRPLFGPRPPNTHF